jgi:murein DD-endopeptidase MepM/ murein hydrolase activator NlpD
MPSQFKLEGTVGPANDVEPRDGRKLKQALIELGFLEAPEDGATDLVDSATLRGLEAFQKENGLIADGVAKPGGTSERLIAAALAERDGVAAGAGFALSDSVGEKAANQPEDVRSLKRALAAVGQFPQDKAQDPTGRLDADLELAVRSFQRDFNLKRDGLLRPGGETERTLDRVVKPEMLAQAQKPAGAAAQQPGGVSISSPVTKQTVIRGFGPRPRPLPGASTMHNGVDFKAPLGTAIHSTHDGTVKTIGNEPASSGNFILIQNDDGSMSGYAHTGALPALRQGQKVRSGQRIGESDNSGRTTGPHLHYTYRPGTKAQPASRRTRPVDPLKTVFKGMKPTP